MKRILTTILACTLALVALQAQSISYKGEEIQLGPHAFYVDGSIETPPNSPYIFASFSDAMEHVIDGTPEDPMRVYIAPWVYWVDDPDDPEDRRPLPGQGGPIGMFVKCESLQLLGMGDDPRDVILASARGQTQGSIGNFTMFDFSGDDLVVKDLTMGNYCNLDLEYPRKPELGRPKRGSAVTQAQVAFTHGDRIYVENVRFVARLNLCPLLGPGRTLYVGCHFESTDDSLNGSGVYVGCDFDFWGRQPYGGTSRYGVVMMDCDFNVRHNSSPQAMSKGVGRVSLVDCRYHAGHPVSLAWTLRPEEWLRCYEYNISLDGEAAFIGAAKPYNTVILEQTDQLAAYRLVDDDGSVIYNTYNLLRGDDDWDPQGIKDRVWRLSRRDGKDYTSVGTCLDMNVQEAHLQTGGEPLTLEAHVYRHGGCQLDNQAVLWRIQPGYERFVEISSAEGNVCKVMPTNHQDQTQVFDVIAYTRAGLECAVKLTVAPDYLPAPGFAAEPKLTFAEGCANVDYLLELDGRADESLVTWYRCDDRKGRGAIPVSVSRGAPLKTYTLTKEDIGHYIMAGVAPKHLRCDAGEERRVVSKSAVKKSDVVYSNVLETDFAHFPCTVQTAVKPGYWTVDAFKPEDTADYDWTVDNRLDSWVYGPGINGAKGLGIQQVQQGARLRFTPVKGKYGDMSVIWQVDPAKDAGQGFASARQQYLDLFIKFDTQTLTGYALRLIRTTKYANAVDVLLVRYTNGHVEPISESISTDCFRTGCVLSLETSGSTLKAHVEGIARQSEHAGDPNIHHVVDLEASITPNAFGGLGLQHTSTVGAESRILVHSLKAEWK